jgi:hypothetical protein
MKTLRTLIATLAILLSAASQSGLALATTNNDKNHAYNDTVWYDPNDGGTCADSATTLNGKDVEQQIFNYFVGKGLTAQQAAGIVGNAQQESGFNPKSPNPAASGGGGGLFQWEGDRWSGPQGLLAFAAKRGTQWTDTATQLDFTWWEMNNNRKQTLPLLKAASTPSQAADAFEQGFEGAGNPQNQNREKYAEAAYKLLGGSASSGSTTAPTTDNNCTGGPNSVDLGTSPCGPTNGNAQQLAQEILKCNRISFQIEPQERNWFATIAQSGTQEAGNPGAFCHSVAISPKLLAVLLAATAKFKIVIGVVATGHDCDQFNHPKGKAVDLNGVTRISDGAHTANGGNRIDWSAAEQPVMKDFYQTVASLLSQSGTGGMGQIDCFTSVSKPTAPKNVTFFSDSCTHQHVDVGTY